MAVFFGSKIICMLKVGITGGIGSGKSFICQILEKMGYSVYYSDLESKIMMDNDEEIRSELITLFGDKVYQGNHLNRAFLAQQIFTSDSNRNKVNNIVHPKVRSYFDEWCKSQNGDILFNEAAILFETDAYKRFDYMILVSAPKELKIHRVIQRDQVSIEEVEQRMSKQWTDEQKSPLSDFIIINDNRPILGQIEAIVEELISIGSTL